MTLSGRYELLGELGRGGLGTVWLARRLGLGGQVVVKQLHYFARRLDVDYRFLEGLAVTLELRHPRLVTVYDVFLEDGVPCLVMEFLRGGSLSGTGGQLSIEQFAGVMESALSALSYAERQDVLHLDLKPANLLIAADGSVKVSELGVLAAFAPYATPGRVFGTAAYMAPEQVRTEGFSARTDLYGLGAVAYELLCGRAPFADARSGQETLERHLESPVPSPLTFRPDLDARLVAWLEKLLEKEAERRPASARDAWFELEDVVIDLAGPRWRRAASLLAESAEPPPRPAPAATPDSVEGPAMIEQPAEPGIPTFRPHPTVGSPAVEPEPTPSYPPPTPVPAPAAAAPAPQPRPLDAEALAELRAAAPAEPASPAAAGEGGEIVDCSVFAPPVVPPRDTAFVQVFVHLPEQAADARALATEFDEATARRAFKTLEATVRRGDRLGFELTTRTPWFEIPDPFQTLVWDGRAASVQFEVEVPGSITIPSKFVGTVVVSRESVPIGHVKFTFLVEFGPLVPEPEPVGESATGYRRAFVSYAATDREKVLTRVQMLRAFGIDYFQDVLELEPGERWERELYRAIDDCDLFLLFWSSEAKRSEWVRREAAYALERKRADDGQPPEILPVIVEGPPVEPPWEELSHLHFNDRIVYFLAAG